MTIEIKDTATTESINALLSNRIAEMAAEADHVGVWLKATAHNCARVEGPSIGCNVRIKNGRVVTHVDGADEPKKHPVNASLASIAIEIANALAK